MKGRGDPGERRELRERRDIGRFFEETWSEVINMLTGVTLEELYEIRVEEAEERGAARVAKEKKRPSRKLRPTPLKRLRKKRTETISRNC